MPYVVTKRGGKKVKSPFLYTDEDVYNLKKSGYEDLELVSPVTRRKIKIKKR